MDKGGRYCYDNMVMTGGEGMEEEMKKTLILLAGYPGTGKSYLAKMLMERFQGFRLLSPDDIKEEYWDTYGFRDLEEKEKLIVLSWQEYYKRMEQAFAKEELLISDYPFSGKQKDRLADISSQYGYQVITIRLVGDIGVLFERQKKRDLDDSRHLGHIVCCYQKSAGPVQHEEADNLLSYEEFYKRCTERGYGEFSLGKTVEVDVTDFAKVDYAALFEELCGDICL